jgi:hypothetical protein
MVSELQQRADVTRDSVDVELGIPTKSTAARTISPETFTTKRAGEKLAP